MSAAVELLVLYYSANGSVAAMANVIARGVGEVDGAEARLRTVPRVSPIYDPTASDVPSSGPPYADKADLEETAGLLLGSPTRFGQMAAPLRHFLDSTSDLWLSGTLAGKPAGVFTASASLHGGQESTLLGMMLPLLHHGMLLTGLPFTEPALHQGSGGGSPYGAGHVASAAPSHQRSQMNEHERSLCFALGRRVAQIAVRLHLGPN